MKESRVDPPPAPCMTDPEWRKVRSLPGNAPDVEAGVVAYRCAIVHSKTITELEYLPDGLLVVDHSREGLILDLLDVEHKSLEEVDEIALHAHAHEVVQFEGRIILPGLIDTHAHAPQYAFTGTGMHLPLLEWLESYTFPCEARFADLDFARDVYSKSIRRHLMNGTTTCSYFATLHLEASKLLVDIVREQGQRAYVGKVSMDRNSPEFYVESTEQGIKDAAEFVRYTKRTSIGPPINTGASSVPPRLKRVMSETRIVRDRRESLGSFTDLESPETSDPENEDAAMAAALAAAGESGTNGKAGGARDSGVMGKGRRSMSLCHSSYSSSSAASVSPSTGEGTPQVVAGRGAGNGNKSSCSATSVPSPRVQDRFDAFGDAPSPKGTLPPPPLVTPVITPRFVPSCTPEMLQALGDLSRAQNLPVQSHLSESQGEVAWVQDLHPECENYTDVYRTYGLLHERAYFAHCCHCSNGEQDVLKDHKAGVSHCPSSNFMLGSGVLNVRKLLQRGMKVGLGTDVAGGYSASILDAARQAIIASRCISFTEKDEQDQPYEALTIDEVFFLATQGGADVLGLGGAVGNFSPGKYMDAVIVDPKTEDGPLDMFDGEHLHAAFEKFLFLGDDRNIEQVYVGGKRVL